MALDKFTSFDVWFLENLDTGERLQGQFVAINPTENIANKYSSHSSLNRKSPIRQFLSGETDTLSFQVKLFARDTLFSKVRDDLTKIKEFARYDDKFNRPPILHFWVGDEHIQIPKCTIDSLSGITYSKPTVLGALREVNLTVNLSKYDNFSFEESEPSETRYHRAVIWDYYEILAQREYGNATIGDVIRKRHPEKTTIQPSDIIKLPSFEAIRKEVVEPKSIPLQTAFGRKETPQRTLRLESFEDKDRSKYSHIVIE